jgi:hydrogenase maturation protease
MSRTLVIGYGNVDRADDGVAYYVVNALRQRLGQKPLADDDSGLQELGAQTDTILLAQLVPELIDMLADYDQVIFVDAHVRDDVPDLYCAPVSSEYVTSPFTHHITPGMLLALLHALCQRDPVGYLVSVRGHDFDFHRSLSPVVEQLVPAAVEHIWQRLVPREREC